MGMTFKVSSLAENLYITVSGEFSLDEAKRCFLGVVDAIKQHKVGKVLIDGRGIEGRPRVLERFFYGHFASESVQRLRDLGWDGPDLQFAYLLEEPVLDRFRLGEAAAASRGMNVKAFDNDEAALLWLLPELSGIEDTADQNEIGGKEQTESRTA